MHPGFQVAHIEIASRGPQIDGIIARHLDGESRPARPGIEPVQPAEPAVMVHALRDGHTRRGLLGGDVEAVEKGLRALDVGMDDLSVS